MACYTGIIRQNIIDYGIDGVSGLCDAIADKHKRECWSVVGERVKSIASNEDERYLSCSVAPEKYINDCLLLSSKEQMTSAADVSCA